MSWLETSMAMTTDSPAAQRKIVDCFLFYNELDMLEYRLSVLYDIVDYFVICEASVTFVGKPKPFFYLENKERYARFADKIVHVMMTDENTRWVYNPEKRRNEAWANERTHRNGIARGVEQLEKEGKIGQCRNSSDNDLLLICDLDEIPNPELLEWMKKEDDLRGRWNGGGGASLAMDFYYYNLTCMYANGKWTRAKAVFFDTFRNEFQRSAENIREHCFGSVLEKGGWHFSYFGGEQFIKNKIENFSHQELNVDNYTNLDNIRIRIENKTDLYDRESEVFKYVKLEENEFFPPVSPLLEKWAK
jgi:beta-1,4-mannosyl-glycoprotein beta-1,4-N-acetylglucosaminyltransferase